MSNERRDHFWIPDEEVVRLDKTLTARPAPRNVPYAEHGQKLSHSLQSIKQSIENVAADNSLIDSDLMIFKVELPNGEKIKDKKDIFISTGMQVKAVKSENKAVIATTKTQFQLLKKRVDDYTHSGTGKTYFDFIEDFKPYVGSEKNSSALQKTTCSDAVPTSLDVQLMIVPNLGEEVNERVIKRLIDKISAHEGSIQEQPYYLSDNTSVIRAIIPSSSLMHYETTPPYIELRKPIFLVRTLLQKTQLTSTIWNWMKAFQLTVCQ